MDTLLLLLAFTNIFILGSFATPVAFPGHGPVAVNGEHDCIRSFDTKTDIAHSSELCDTIVNCLQANDGQDFCSGLLGMTEQPSPTPMPPDVVMPGQ
jgi:hypothetical protein